MLPLDLPPSGTWSGRQQQLARKGGPRGLVGTDRANKLSLRRACGLAPSGSGEQGPKPTNGLMAVSLL